MTGRLILILITAFLCNLSYQDLRARVKAHNPSLMDERNSFLHIFTAGIFILTVETLFGAIYAS